VIEENSYFSPLSALCLSLLSLSIFSVVETGIDLAVGLEVTFVQLEGFDLDNQVERPNGRINVEEKCV